MVTSFDIKSYLNEENRKDLEFHRVHCVIGKILREKFEGKRLTRNIVRYLEAALTVDGKAPVIAYACPSPGECGTASVQVWGTASWPTYNERVIFFIGQVTPPHDEKYKGHCIGEIHADGFEEHDIAHGQAALDRIAERSRLLNDEVTIQRFVSQIEALKRAWDELHALTQEGAPGEILYHKLSDWTRHLTRSES